MLGAVESNFCERVYSVLLHAAAPERLAGERECFSMERKPGLAFQSGTGAKLNRHPASGLRLVDIAGARPNNRPMARPEAVRRVKSYSAATGFVYQYYFYEVQKARRGLSAGTEFVYMVSVDRQTAFPLRIFVRRSAVEDWARKVGRKLSGTEEYAVAKIRLFQAFDEVEDLATARPELLVDESNLETLLAQLDI